MVGGRVERDGEDAGGGRTVLGEVGLRREAWEESEPQALRAVGCSRVTLPLWAPVSPAMVPRPVSVSLGSSSLWRLHHMRVCLHLLLCFPFSPSLPSAPLSIYCPPGSRLSPD